ncbi:hypothetical protein LCGC14_2056560 [marine sediment metagenome]|uniref:VRR-NUC domain-containing protein n=1 Tax=marine sediment metagenome TaxID=412755 RepID=A0A0F9EMG5_9ZZZZ
MDMTEKKLSQNIVNEARDLGWLVNRPWLSIYSPKGYPDLTMVRGGKILFWELKTAKGKVSAAQQEWLDALALVPGVDVRVVRPDDLEEAYRILVEGLVT